MSSALKNEILVILGNGFDLELGLKTSYKSFYESEYWPFDKNIEKKHQYALKYLGHIPLLPNFRLLSVYLNSVMAENWYNLETSLAQYALSYKRNKYVDFVNKYFRIPYIYQALLLDIPQILVERDVYNELLDYNHLAYSSLKSSLCRYITNEQLEFLSNPNPSSENKSIRFLKKIYEKRNPIIYTFNYTDLTSIAKHVGIDNVRCTHVHGSINDYSIILGIEDNTNNRQEYDFLKKMSDPTYKSTDLYYDLMNSNDVIIFGHSLGESDFHYFSQFFDLHSDENKSNNKCKITIFTANNESKLDILAKIRKMNHGRNYQLFAQNNIQFIETLDNDYGFETWMSNFQ